MRATVLTLTLFLAACANVPELAERITDAGKAAPNPRLVPIEPMVVSAHPSPSLTEAEAILIARAARLRARAARIRAGG